MPFSGDIHKGSRQNNVNDIISLINNDIRFCRGCLACQKLGKCVINDDVNAIMQKVLNADVIESRLAGTLFCGGVDAPRTIEGNDKLQEAYNLGMSI